MHEAAKLIFGGYPKVTGKCDYNSKTILNIMSYLMGSCQPPYDFIRRYCLPIRSTIIRELILHHTLTQKVAKFQLLQKFVSQRFECNMFKKCACNNILKNQIIEHLLASIHGPLCIIHYSYRLTYVY